MPDDKPARSSPPAVPTPLDRGALERVLTRAAELQAQTVEPSEGMTEQELVELGGEVGISSDFMRRALAEERTRVGRPSEAGSTTLAGLFGPERVSASRIVRGSPAAILAALDDWMQRQESMLSMRRMTDRLTWEPRRDFLGNLQRGFNFRGKTYELVVASEVAASVAAIDAQRTLVRIDADLGAARRRSTVGSGVVAGGGVASASAIVGLATLFPEGSLLIGGVVGAIWAGSGVLLATAIARRQRRKVSRVQLALEQILDRLERDEIKTTSPSLLDLLVPRPR
ncbi:MAG TPA: hypothetical protein VGQ52_05385 [Gemmatimonadaceae bacterium]|nr:hypothetical protein [Gemmatimonadaceae bacterium]